MSSLPFHARQEFLNSFSTFLSWSDCYNIIQTEVTLFGFSQGSTRLGDTRSWLYFPVRDSSVGLLLFPCKSRLFVGLFLVGFVVVFSHLFSWQGQPEQGKQNELPTFLHPLSKNHGRSRHSLTTRWSPNFPGVSLLDHLQILQKKHLTSARALILPRCVIFESKARKPRSWLLVNTRTSGPAGNCTFGGSPAHTCSAQCLRRCWYIAHTDESSGKDNFCAYKDR